MSEKRYGRCPAQHWQPGFGPCICDGRVHPTSTTAYPRHLDPRVPVKTRSDHRRLPKHLSVPDLVKEGLYGNFEPEHGADH